MTGTIQNLPREYRAALKKYLAGGGEEALRNAYLLGRQALEQGIGMLDISAAHHRVLAALLGGAAPVASAKSIVKQSGDFLAECLSPYEMAQRGFRESITALQSLNIKLEDEVAKRTSAMRASEALYRSLIEVSPDSITMTDLEGKVVLCNRRSALMHGFASPEEAIGAHTGEFVVPDDMPRVREMGQRVLHEGITGELEYMLVRKDGARIPVEVRTTLLRDAQGNPSGFIGINRDVSERRQAQLKLESRARWQAAVTELGLRALAGVELDRLMREIVGEVARTLDVEFCELLELLPDGDSLVLREGIGWKPGMIGSTVIRAGEGSQAGYTLMAAEPVMVENLAQETRFVPPAFLTEHAVVSGMTVIIHGKERPYGILGAHTSRSVLFTPDETTFLQSIANVMAMAVDNRRLLETEARARQKAERDNEQSLRSLAIVSHELRTPLTSIKGFATTLLAEDVAWDAGSQRDFIRTIDEEADKLSGLIEQLLDLSKMDAGVFKYAPTRQTPADLIAASMAHLQALTGDYELAISLPEALPQVFADTQRAGQVLENLVENATKYAPRGTAIKISVREVDGFVEISVADQGPGIPPHEREQIFQAFYRARDKETLKTKGAGLGLTICRRLVEAQGGRIWVAERAAPGAVISFTLPLAGVLDESEG